MQLTYFLKGNIGFFPIQTFFECLFSLIDNFQWQGAFLASGAVVVLCVFFGGLFRPLSHSSNISDTTTTSHQNVNDNDDGEEKASMYKMPHPATPPPSPAMDRSVKSMSVNHSFANGQLSEKHSMLPMTPNNSQNGSFASGFHTVINSPVIFFL